MDVDICVFAMHCILKAWHFLTHMQLNIRRESNLFTSVRAKFFSNSKVWMCVYQIRLNLEHSWSFHFTLLLFLLFILLALTYFALGISFMEGFMQEKTIKFRNYRNKEMECGHSRNIGAIFKNCLRGGGMKRWKQQEEKYTDRQLLCLFQSLQSCVNS